MSGAQAVSRITENMEAALRALGLCFSAKAFDDGESVPASLLPLGQIFYLGEEFEESLGCRPGYAEVAFLVKVTSASREPSALMREQQKITHSIRGALTVDALNTGGLSAEKSVSRVTIRGSSVEGGSSRSDLAMKVVVRYREAQA